MLSDILSIIIPIDKTEGKYTLKFSVEIII